MIPTARQPHWFLLANRSRPSTLNPNSISQDPKLKPINRRRNLPSRVHGARLDSNSAPWLQESNPKPIRNESPKSAPKARKMEDNMGVRLRGIRGGNPGSSPLGWFESDRRGFGIRLAARNGSEAAKEGEEELGRNTQHRLGHVWLWPGNVSKREKRCFDY